ncbi:MAG: DUF3037 domain-containing protein [Verrucomicrobiaceae bacterium]|nr:MAG: DUF3037 domain-containing protein [Verrucomicrobiaceae bacterium]
MKTAYTYTILRYVHDVAAGETLNVGIVLYAPSVRYVGALLQTRYSRLRQAFPMLDGDAHRQLMRYLQNRFDDLQGRVSTELPFNPQPESIDTVVCQVLPKDDSSLQWSQPGGGLTANPEAELERLYARLVAANDQARAEDGRDDEMVWSHYRAPLAREKVLPHLTTHKVIAPDDEVEFEHAWKNHQWHCLQPLSLDLLKADSIKDKARRLLGQMVGVQGELNGHCLYVMVGEPQLEKCKPAAERALNLLHSNLPVKHEIIREAEAEVFSREFAARIQRHTAELV